MDLLAIVILLVLLDVAALRWGRDSRDTLESNPPSEHSYARAGFTWSGRP